MPAINPYFQIPGDLLETISGMIDVRAYGAEGDGLTDDTAAIAAAILAGAGKVVYFPAGTYLTTGLTVANSRTAIVGAGPATILLASGTGATILTVNNAASNVTIRDLTLRGTKTNESGGVQRGIYVAASAHRGLIQNVVFDGTLPTTGLNIQVYLDAVNYWTVRACRLENVIGTNSGYGYGMLIVTCVGCSVVDNLSIQSATQGRHHVYLSAGTSRSIVTANRCEGGVNVPIALYALDVQSWIEENVIANNVICNTAANISGLYLEGKVRYNLVQGNVIYNCGGHGIGLIGAPSGSVSFSPDNVISGNLVCLNGLIGILALGSDRAQILGNYVYNNSQASSGTYAGIQVSPGSGSTPTSQNQVIGNVILGADQRYPLVIAAGSGVNPTGTVVRGNQMPEGASRYAMDGGDQTIIDELYVLKRRLTYTNFSTAGLTQYVDLFNLGPGEKVESVTIKHETAFSGGAISAYTVSVGIASNYTKYAGAFDVFQAVGATVFQDANTTGFENLAMTETAIRALATATGANLDAATAGVVQVWVKVRRYAMTQQ